MNTSNNINAATVLNSLSSESVIALENHYRSQILSTLTATLGAPTGSPAIVDDNKVVVEAPAKRGRPAGSKNKKADEAEAPVKRGPGRPAGSKNKEKAEVGPSGRAKAAKAAAGPTPRAKAKDGRSASQVVRDFDEKYNAKHEEEAQASLVVAHCEKLGLEIAPSLVYNVRQNVKKAAAEAAKASKKAKKAAK